MLPWVESLPLPVATLVTKAELAKSPRDRHDHAFWAWDLSVRLRYFSGGFRPIAERPSLGQWVREQVWSRAASLTDPSLAAVARLFAQLAQRDLPPGPVSPSRLVEWLAAYRNEVIGHSTPRSHAFCREAAERLLAGLGAAWQAGVFLPPDARLIVKDVTDDGRPRALSLMGPVPRALEAVDDELRDGHVYLVRPGERPVSLYPALLFREEGPRPTLWFYDGGEHRRAAYRDFDGSGGASRLDDVVTHTPTPGAPAPAPPSGDAREGYEILGVLGEGGMGIVQLARSRVLGGLVALKRVRPLADEGPRTRRRFLKEVDTLRACAHPNVVRLVDSGADDGGSYLAMEFVEGPSLAQLAAHAPQSSSFATGIRAAWLRVRAGNPALERHTAPMEAPEASSEPRWRGAVQALITCANALGDLHDKGVLHRDLSPGNILIVAADGRVVLADFGLATRDEDDAGTTTSHALGTRQYAAPERQLGAPASARADQYSLVASFLEVLCDPATLAEHRLRGLETLSLRASCPGMPVHVEAALLRALARDPGRRHEDARALAAACGSAGPAPAAAALVTGVGSPAEPPPVRSGWPARRALGLAGAVVALTGLVAWRLAGGPEPSKLAKEDEGLRDTRQGWDWSDRCFTHLKADRLANAQAACERGLEIAPFDPPDARRAWARPSLYYNLGLIAMKRGELATARRQLAMSLSRRPNDEVQAKLAEACRPDGLTLGEGEVVRVVSWDRDQTGGTVREGPSTRTAQLAVLQLGTCLVTGEIRRVSETERWLQVRYRAAGGGLGSGWMHEIVLAPRPSMTGEVGAARK
ncbi:MAG: serine/threonine protein kinase [Polyangiaceae bacterium]|nr:serine/threonine protein kinase [Polyangiaceae bacterium]